MHSIARPTSSSWLRRLLIIVLIVAAVVVALGFLIGPIAKSVINRKLAEMPDYTGHVDGVSVSLWRGRTQISNAVLRLRSAQDQPPLASIRRADLNVSYSKLLTGRLSAQSRVDYAEINVSPPVVSEVKDAPKEKKDPEAAKQKIASWQDTLRKTFPVEITRLEVLDARIRYVDKNKQPNVDVGMDHFHLIGTGLGNKPPPSNGPFPAKVTIDAITTGNGKMRLEVDADPLSQQPKFNTRFQLRELSLPAFNSFLLAFANADVGRGTFEFDSEVKAEGGRYDGYVKPFFKDLDFHTASDKDKPLLQRVTKKAVSAVASVLKNDEENKVATKAPFAGSFENNQVDIWTTIVNLLRNAFIQGLREGFEGQTPSR